MNKITIMFLAMFSLSVFAAKNETINGAYVVLSCTEIEQNMKYVFYANNIKINNTARTKCYLKIAVKPEWRLSPQRMYARSVNALGIESNDTNSEIVSFIKNKPATPTNFAVSETK